MTGIAAQPAVSKETTPPQQKPLFSAKTLSGQITAYRATADVSAELWSRYSRPHWKDYRFQQLAEETLYEGMEHACLVIADPQGETLAIQPVFLIRQDLALGTPPFLTRAVWWVRSWWPHFLEPRMLMAGSLAGEGQLAMDQTRTELAISALQEGVELYAQHCGARLITFKEFPATTRPALQALTSRGYVRVPSYPSVRMPVAQPTFEKHLEHLTPATRKDLRRKFRESAACGLIQMEVVEQLSPPLVDELYALYLQVFERSEVRFERLTPSYFARVAEVLPDRVRWFLWRHEGRVVAFKLCFVHDGILYDDYIGLDYSVALDLHLYFVTFRDLYTWAATHGIREYFSTPLSYDPKLRLGFQLAPLDLYLRHTSTLVNVIYTRLAKAMGPIAGDPTLNRFPNFSEL